MFDAKEQWLGKDSTLELKRVVSWGKGIAGLKRFDLADELAAMANTHDGVMVLGVDDCTRGKSWVSRLSAWIPPRRSYGRTAMTASRHP